MTEKMRDRNRIWRHLARLDSDYSETTEAMLKCVHNEKRSWELLAVLEVNDLKQMKLLKDLEAIR